MIRSKVILSIIRKDALEALRDPTTLIVNYLLPIVLWPVVLMVVSGMVATDSMIKSQMPASIGLVGETVPGLKEFLEKKSRLKAKTLAFDRVRLRDSLVELEQKDQKRQTAAAESSFGNGSVALQPKKEESYLYSLLKKNELNSLIVLEKGKPEEAEFRVSYLSITENMFGMKYAREVELEIEEFNQELRKEKAKQLGVPLSSLVPIAFVQREISSSSGALLDILSKVLPFVLVYVLCFSTTQLAMNTIVEEREKGTLSLLWSAPVHSMEIVLAKFFHIVAGGLMTLSLHVLSIGLAMLVARTMTSSISINVAAPFQTFLFVLCIAASLGSVSLVAGAIAKNRGQGNGILSLSMLGVFGIVLGGGLMGLNWVTCFIPLYNALLGVSEALRGPLSLTQTACITATNAVFAWVLLSLANQLFRMASTGSPLQLSTKDFGIVKSDPHLHQSLPGPEVAGGLVVFAFFSAIYFFGVLRVPLGGVLMQSLIFGLAPLVIAWLLKFNITLSFNLRKTNLRSLVGSILIGLCLPLVALTVVSLIPFPEKSQGEFTFLIDKLLLKGGWPLLIAFFGLMPALFEEWFFRGIVLNGLRKALPPFWAVALTSVVFGLIHLNPIQIVFAFVVGGIAGAALIRSGSLLNSIIIHFLYNTTVVSLCTVIVAAKRGGVTSHLASGDSPQFTPATAALVVAIGVVGTLAGYWCLQPESGD